MVSINNVHHLKSIQVSPPISLGYIIQHVKRRIATKATADVYLEPKMLESKLVVSIFL